MKNRILIKSIIILCFTFPSFSGCNTIWQNKDIRFAYNDTCSCDSIFQHPNFNFIWTDDSSLINIVEKKPFKYFLYTENNPVKITGNNYNFLIAGSNPDTVGLIRIQEGKYLFRPEMGGKDEKLFDLTGKIGESWQIEGDGFFSDYTVTIREILYNANLKDTVYIFDYDYTGIIIPFNRYFSQFEVLKTGGIISFTFDDDITCTYY